LIGVQLKENKRIKRDSSRRLLAHSCQAKP